jgi:Na+/melibiose symporter-like transporter
MAAQIIPNIFSGPRDAFTWNVGWLYQNVFHLDKGPQSVISVISGVWDGLNDPIIGAYMDHKNYRSQVNRWVMRAQAIVIGLLSVIQMFHLGLSTWQRVLLIIVVNNIKSLFSTAGNVSGSKVYAQITPHSDQRARVISASAIGGTIHDMLTGLFWPLIGLKDILDLNPYVIFLIGTILFSIPAIFTDMAPSFVRQRVPDTPQPEKKLSLKELAIEIKDCFAIMRHNKFFLLNTFARFITVFTPSVSDGDFYRFCGISETVNELFPKGKGKVNGELLLSIRGSIAYAPATIAQPFAVPLIKKVGGARNMMVLNSAVNAGFNLLRYFAGVKTIPGILFVWGSEMFANFFGKIDGVAANVIKYEMFDYVEWKTGRRSEGVNMAVDGLLNKVVLNQIDTVVGNLALAKAGFRAALELNQPASYVKWATIFYFLSPVFDQVVYIVCRMFYKYPEKLRRQVEEELIERRKLAEKMAKAAEVTAGS